MYVYLFLYDYTGDDDNNNDRGDDNNDRWRRFRARRLARCCGVKFVYSKYNL